MQNKRIKTVVAVVATVLISVLMLLSSCGNKGNWTQKERRAAQDMLREWREIVYLGDLSEEEFALFTNNVTDYLERHYPSYVEFIEMPMVGDSVEMVVIAAIINEINASPERLRHIFTYHDLVEAKVLPSGLKKEQQHAFYKCFAEKVNMIYGSMQQFVWDAIYSSLDDLLIAQMMGQCAAPFWEIKK